MTHRLFLWSCVLVVLAVVPGRSEENEPDPIFEGDPAGFEYPLLRALGEDADIYERQLGRPLPLDPEAAALQRGDWLHAYSEITATINDADEGMAAPAHARSARILARLGIVTYAAAQANQVLSHDALRGEVMLARAWIFWHGGGFERAIAEADVAASGRHPAPAWALAEWKHHVANHRQAAGAFSASVEPDDCTTAEFLNHAELACRAGAFNAAALLYQRAESMLQQEQFAVPGTPRDRYERALAGHRDVLLGLFGGKLPGPAYAHVRTLILRAARAAAVESLAKGPWVIYFKLVAEVLEAPGDFDFVAIDLIADVDAAERLAGVDTAWRKRFKAQLADPRLRYASDLARSIEHCEAHAAAAAVGDVSEPLDPAGLLEQIASEERVLSERRAQIPAGAAPVPGEERFVQLAALARLRDALNREDLAEARTQFERVDATDAYYDFDRWALIKAVEDLERVPFVRAVDALRAFTLEETPTNVWEEALEQTERTARRLAGESGEIPDTPAQLPSLAREDMARILSVRVQAEARSGHVLAAERALKRLEAWCKAAEIAEFPDLEAAQATVLEMPPDPEDLTAEERTIADALAAGGARREFVAVLEATIQREPDRLQPRLLLMHTLWQLCEDLMAGHQIALIRPLVPTNLAVPELLDELRARNDRNTVCDKWRAAIKTAAPERRVALAREAERDLGALLERYHRALNAGKPIEPEQDIGDHKYGYYGVLGTVACTQAVQGGLRGALDLLPHLPYFAEQETREFLADVPFRHDLPGEAHERAWRELLQDKVLTTPVLVALHQIFTPHYGRSLTADLALVVLQYRNHDYDKARDALERLRASYGANRAIAAQLDQLDALFAEHTRVTLLFGDSLSVDRELEQTRAELRRYVDAHREVLQETYAQDGTSPETLAVDAMESRIADLNARGMANVAEDQRQLDNAAAGRARAQTRAFGALLELTVGDGA